MKKTVSILLVLAVLTVSLFALAACGDKAGLIIAVPNDPTNEARALILLQENGIIKLEDGVGITATINNIVENPLNIDFKEVEAARIPSVLPDVDYAVIDSNHAVAADMKPAEQSLLIEGAYSAYSSIVAVKNGDETKDSIKALVAALESQEVADYIKETYDGAVISVVENPGDGYDASVDYDALKGTEISVAARPAPHAEVLEVAKKILAEKDISLKIIEFTDYVQPNKVVDSGEIDANYCQHFPYLDDFNKEQGTDLVNAADIHLEPMGLYGGRQTTLDALNLN